MGFFQGVNSVWHYKLWTVNFSSKDKCLERSKLLKQPAKRASGDVIWSFPSLQSDNSFYLFNYTSSKSSLGEWSRSLFHSWVEVEWCNPKGFWCQVTHPSWGTALWISALSSQTGEGLAPYTAPPPPRHTKSCLTMGGEQMLCEEPATSRFLWALGVHCAGHSTSPCSTREPTRA